MTTLNVTLSADLRDDWRAAAKGGVETFNAIGCASCHMQTLPLKSLVFTDPAPYDMAGTLRSGEVKEPIRIDLGTLPFAKTLQKNDKGEWLIPLYSDLKRHLIVDERVNALGNELQAQRFVERDVFLTPRLWGVGSTAPYGHNGAFRMLDEIIAAHGGDARFSRDAYLALDQPKRDGVVVFYLAPEGDALLVHRPESHNDGAIPAGAAIATKALLRLGLVAGDADALALAETYLAQRLTGATGAKAGA